MNSVREILQQFIGKSIANIYEVVTDYSLVYKIEFSDGVFLEFHGGSVGYENADPWYEICGTESNLLFSGQNHHTQSFQIQPFVSICGNLWNKSFYM